MSTLAETGARLLGGTVRRAEMLAGGDLSQLVRLVLTDGREAIVKKGASSRAEAAMLEAIAAGGAPAPKVLAVGDDALVLEVVPAGGSLHGAWRSLGTAIAALHTTAGERYGWAQDYAFGPVAIENAWSGDWTSFWAERRLLVNIPHVPVALGKRIEELAADISNRLPRNPRPSLLHGDLWSGNVLVDDNRVSAFIDPACYYGPGEVDLAMLTLFDHPSAAFYSAYGELEPGHDERLVLYRLWPALVHLRLFGGGYQALVERLLTAAGV
ncbi:MAG: fructosamine kinase family protein [Alphaproteobacteria bacterium]|nr:fructosamine kinase family protein [Alphaproteobacteria bacterium]